MIGDCETIGDGLCTCGLTGATNASAGVLIFILESRRRRTVFDVRRNTSTCTSIAQLSRRAPNAISDHVAPGDVVVNDTATPRGTRLSDNGASW
jgi:hypothetical protein